ncbi:hypothetical protein FLTE109939_04785 [Flavobacterium terrigena]
MLNDGPLPIGDPPVALAYQFNVPVQPEALKVTLPVPHRLLATALGAGGTPEKPPAAKSCNDAVKDCEFLVSKRNLLKHGLIP